MVPYLAYSSLIVLVLLLLPFDFYFCLMTFIVSHGFMGGVEEIVAGRTVWGIQFSRMFAQEVWCSESEAWSL